MFVPTLPALIAAQIYSPANVPNDQIQKVIGLEQLAAVTGVPNSAACEALCTGRSGNLGFFQLRRSTADSISQPVSQSAI